MALGLCGAAGNGCFVGVGSRGAFKENRPDRFIFVGLTGLAGVLATAAYDFVAFPDVGSCAVSVGRIVPVCVGGGHGVGCGSVGALSSVGLGGVGPCVGDGTDGAPECSGRSGWSNCWWGGMGSASRCG